MKKLPISEIVTGLRDLDVSAYAVREAISAGDLRVLPLGAKRLIDLEEARAYFTAKRRPGIGIDALSTATGLRVSAIRRGVRDGWIPCERRGRALWFDLEQVMQAIEARMIGNVKG